MKLNARKKMRLFKTATNKTGGGGRPQTPTNDIIVCIFKFIFSHCALHVLFLYRKLSKYVPIRITYL